jgi:hypothetical protein
LKLRSNQVPSPWTISLEIEPLSAWMNANERLSVAIAQSCPITAPNRAAERTGAARIRSNPPSSGTA